jgi:hypothetical protein
VNQDFAHIQTSHRGWDRLHIQSSSWGFNAAANEVLLDATIAVELPTRGNPFPHCPNRSNVLYSILFISISQPQQESLDNRLDPEIVPALLNSLFFKVFLIKNYLLQVLLRLNNFLSINFYLFFK